MQCFLILSGGLKVYLLPWIANQSFTSASHPKISYVHKFIMPAYEKASVSLRHTK